MPPRCKYIDFGCGRYMRDCVNCYVINMNLCETCKNSFGECEGKNAKFGSDIDTEPKTRQSKDNVFYCESYKRQEGSGKDG